MSFLLVNILDLNNGLGYGYGRYEHMSLEGFIYMCGFVLVLLLINRVLGKKKSKKSVFKDENFSNYTLDFSNLNEPFNIKLKEKKVSKLTKAIIYFVVIVLVFYPISDFIKTFNSYCLWF